MAKGRVLVIGFDGADPDTFVGLADAGRAPNLRALIDRSARARVEPPAAVYISANWPAITTGMSPGSLGWHCYEQIVVGTFDLERPSPFDLPVPPVWQLVSEAGHRVVVIDVPHSTPTEGVVQVVEWGAHDADIGFSTMPADLAARIVARHGAHPVPPRCNVRDDTDEALQSLRDQILDGVPRKQALVRELLDETGWDLAMVVFSESHCVGHHFWHLHDATHPDHDPAMVARIGDPVVHVYEALDRALGDVLATVGPDTATVVLMNHGMGPHYDGTFVLDRILRRIEDADGGPIRKAWGRTEEWVWDRLPTRLRRGATGGRNVLWTGCNERLAPRDPHRRRWFKVLNNSATGGVRLNVVGREPSGCIARGTEYDRVCEHLRRALLELTHLDDGAPVVRSVVRADEVHPGPAVDRLPDLFVEWNRDRPITRIGSGRVGVIERRYRFMRTGDHHDRGLVIASGPGGAAAELAPVRSIDLAPTIAAAFGVPTPGMDGTARSDISEILGRRSISGTRPEVQG